MNKLIVTLVLALAGCGGGGKHQEATTADKTAPAVVVEDQGKPTEAPAGGDLDCSKVTPLTDADAETRGLGLVDEMGQVFSTNANDCKALSQAILAWSEKNQTLMTQMNCYTQSLSEERRAAFEEKGQARFEQYAEAMMSAMQNCQEDPEFQKAMEEAVK